MARLFQKGILIALGLVLALLIAIPVANYRYTRQLNEDASEVAHRQEVLTLSASVLHSLVNAETGELGFIITGKDEFLEPYNAALGRIKELLEELKSKTEGYERQQNHVKKLADKTAVAVKLLNDGIDHRRMSLSEAQVFVASKKVKNQMDAIRELVQTLDREERTWLKAREPRTTAAYHTAVMTGTMSALLGLCLYGLSIWLLRSNEISRAKLASVNQEQRDWFRTTLASIGDAVIATDAQGHVVFMNPAAERATAWSEQAANGHPLELVFRIVCEETRKTVEIPTVRAIQEGEVVALGHQSLLIARDGTERCIDESAYPVRNAKGQIVGGVLVFRDISERRSLEKEARRRFELLTMAEVTARIGHFEWEITKNRATWSAELEALYGLPPGGYEGGFTAWRKLIHPGDLLSTEAAMQEALSTGRLQTEFRTVWPDGTIRWLEARALVTKNSEGNPERMIGINMDITDRKQTEVSLREADRRKDEFLAMLAHELRNPLAPIRNAVTILKLAQNDPESQRSSRDVIDRQTRQLTVLVDDLLDVSRITHGKISLTKSPLEVSQFVNHAIKSSRPLIESRKHHLEVNLPDERLRVNGDLNRLSQVVLNLLNNAAKYTPEAGLIRLSIDKEGDWCRICVSDNGEGIPPESLPTLFDMFAQLEKSVHHSLGGLGIGLTLVRRLVEMHGGTVEAHSDGVGQGSEFVVLLPLLREEPSWEEKIAIDDFEYTSDDQSSLRVLIVDDNQDLLATLNRLLVQLGHQVEVAVDGPTALQAASRFEPDLVLLDIGLPGMNGYEVARRLRRYPSLKGIKVVAITGYGTDSDRLRSKDSGFDDHLVKPIEFDQLSSVLNKTQVGKS